MTDEAMSPLRRRIGRSPPVPSPNFPPAIARRKLGGRIIADEQVSPRWFRTDIAVESPE
jgi:hypothetical protein